MKIKKSLLIIIFIIICIVVLYLMSGIVKYVKFNKTINELDGTSNSFERTQRNRQIKGINIYLSDNIIITSETNNYDEFITDIYELSYDGKKTFGKIIVSNNPNLRNKFENPNNKSIKYCHNKFKVMTPSLFEILLKNRMNVELLAHADHNYYYQVFFYDYNIRKEDLKSILGFDIELGGYYPK